MSNPTFSAFWKVLSNDSIILELLELEIFSPIIEKRKKILPFAQYDHILLPKLLITNPMRKENRSIHFLEDLFIDVHVWSGDSTLDTHRKILNRVRFLVDGETLNLGEEYDWWSWLTWEKGGQFPLFASDLFDVYDTYVIPASPVNNKKLGK